MSAYLVEDETINRIVSYIENERHLLGSLGDLNSDFLEAEKLGTAMYKLNCRSLEERYGSADDFEPNGYKYNYELASKIQIFKSLGCFLYQSCEGRCNEDPLYKLLRGIEGGMAKEIISSTPEYNEAKWA